MYIFILNSYFILYIKIIMISLKSLISENINLSKQVTDTISFLNKHENKKVKDIYYVD